MSVDPKAELATPRRRSRWRDVWQLDLPLAVALLVCAGATVIELARAQEGFWRAWVYTFEWPLIGAFAVWIWYRYRFKAGIPRRSRPRPEQPAAPSQTSTSRSSVGAEADPELSRWEEYVRRVRENAQPRDE